MSDPSPPAESRDDAHPPRSHLGWAVAAAVLFFLPVGLVAVYYALRTRSALAEGRPEDAARLARVARRWVIAAIVVGLLLDLALVAVVLMMGAFSP
jgi:Interferon-induced transmembrane protein